MDWLMQDAVSVPLPVLMPTPDAPLKSHQLSWSDSEQMEELRAPWRSGSLSMQKSLSTTSSAPAEGLSGIDRYLKPCKHDHACHPLVISGSCTMPPCPGTLHVSLGIAGRGTACTPAANEPCRCTVQRRAGGCATNYPDRHSLQKRLCPACHRWQACSAHGRGTQSTPHGQKSCHCSCFQVGVTATDAVLPPFGLLGAWYTYCN